MAFGETSPSRTSSGYGPPHSRCHGLAAALPVRLSRGDGEGETPTADQLAQLDAYRTQFESYFQKAASQNATADTTLKKAVHVSAFPPSESFREARHRSESNSRAWRQHRPCSSAYEGRTCSGAAIGHDSCRRSRSNVFRNGISEGTDEIQLEPADTSYESVTARVQVLPATKLQLSALSESSPIRIKVTDANELPYPGVTVQAQATNGGTLDHSMAASDGDGVVEFLWRQQANSDNQLVANVASGPSLTITAGVPRCSPPRPF